VAHEYEVVSTEVAFRGRVVAVHKDSVSMPDGDTSQRDVVVHPGAVAVVALDDTFWRKEPLDGAERFGAEESGAVAWACGTSIGTETSGEEYGTRVQWRAYLPSWERWQAGERWLRCDAVLRGYGPVVCPPGLVCHEQSGVPVKRNWTTPPEASPVTWGAAARQCASIHGLAIGPSMSTSPWPGGVTTWRWAATGIATAASSARAASSENRERFIFLLLHSVGLQARSGKGAWG